MTAPEVGHLALIERARAGDRIRKVAYPIGIRRLEVLRTAPVGAAMRRITLGGPAAAGFESHVPDEHVRVVLPDPDGSLRLPVPRGDRLRWPRPHPVTRVYTVRRHDRAAGEIDLDVALHGDGPGCRWASTARPGDRVHVAGPPGGIVVPRDYGAYLLAGDLTALPAVARRLEELPADARGHAAIEVGGPEEQVPLHHPPGVQITWVHRGPHPPGGPALARAVTALPPPDPSLRTLVWIAGEAGAVAPLRRWSRGLPGSTDAYVTAYWRRGTPDFDEEDGGHGPAALPTETP